MSRVWRILVREYLENVRTKAFLIGVILTPLWFGLVFAVPLLAKSQEVERQRVVVVDATGVLGARLVERLAKETMPGETNRYEVSTRRAPEGWSSQDPEPDAIAHLRREAAEGDLIAILLAPPILEKRASRPDEPESAILHAASVGATEAARLLATEVNTVVNERLMKERGIRPEDAALLEKRAIRPQALARGGGEGGIAQAVTPFIFMLFLFMGIVGISQMLVNSTIEEKGSRVYEVLLSSVSPFQLMAGKVLGICGVGFTLMALWIGGGLVAAQIQGMGGLVTGGEVGLFVAYYVLGFLLIASLMVAVGSACNTLKEAQNLMAPISLLLALPLLIAMIVMKNPNGTFATVASFFPPFTPFLMMARIAAVPGPPPWQVATSLVLLALSTWFAIRLAARVFRVGILMYGKPPSLGEILRWVRTPD
ncbi:MAG: ABC transporter permease [Planctomycetota bacterium]